MKINKTVGDLHKALNKAIYEIGLDDEMYGKVIERMTKHGFSRGYVSGILENNVILDTLSLDVLGLLTVIVHEVSSISYIKPTIFFEDIEIQRVKMYRHEEGKALTYPVSIRDVRRVSNDMFTVVVPAKLITQLNMSNMTNYNFDTQRESTKVEMQGSIIPVPTVNWTSVSEITEELIAGTFIPNTLTFNISKDSDSEFIYNEKNKTLSLLEGKFDIIDGYHRTLAIAHASKVTELDYNFEIRIVNFDTDKARRYIIQEDKKNPIDSSYIKAIDTSDLNTKIVNKLNEGSSSELRGLISRDSSLIHSGYSLVSFELMHSMIKELWNPRSIIESEDIAEYLRDFFNYLISKDTEEFKPREKFPNKFNGLSDEKMFVLYLVTANKVQNEGGDYRSAIDNLLAKAKEGDSLISVVNSENLYNYKNRTKRAIKPIVEMRMCRNEGA